MEHSKIVVPEKGDELYEGLLEIFKGQERLWSGIWLPEFGDESGKDEYYLYDGIGEAKGYLPDYIKYGKPYLDDEREHPPISLGCYIMIWVLLKIQPDGGALEDERARSIFDEFNGRDLRHEERDCNLFNRCVELVTRITSSEAAFKKADESLRFAMGSVENARKKVRDLKGAVKFGRDRIESQKKEIISLKEQIDNLEKSCKRLKGEREKMQEGMNSKEHQQQVGERYLRKVFEEYLRDADEMEQSLRKDWFNVLQGFCSIEGVPKEVKKMIQSLKRKPKGSDGMTVKAEAGSTINNYDIHGNNQVSTNKEG